MVLIIDNYDSFTYNLYQVVGGLNNDVRVVRNDELTIDEIAELRPSHIIISPGPGRPSKAGISAGVVDYFKGSIPILGVCLGLQVICEVFGGEVGYGKTLIHGKKTLIHLANGSPIFRGLSPIIEAGRYHSLSARRGTLPDELLVIAEDDEGEVMGLKHQKYNVFGVQFHPESILTEGGTKIIANFLKLEGGGNND